MKKIVFFVHDPGGVNVIFPLVEALLQKKIYILSVWLKGPAKERWALFYRQFGNLVVDAHIFYSEKITESSLLDQETPDLVITATSAEDFSERILWKEASLRGIKAIAVLDQWLNYSVRFSSYKLSELNLGVSKPLEKKYLPSLIFTLDGFACKEMAIEAFDAQMIYSIGHPYLDYLFKRYDQKFKIENKAFTTALRKVVFFSEPVLDSGIVGYSEKEILLAVVAALENFSNHFNLEIDLCIKLHPRQVEEQFHVDLIQKKRKNLKITYNKNLFSLDCIKWADLVLGIRSFALLEAGVFQKPFLSVQLGMKGVDSFILSRRGKTKSAYSEQELYDFLVSTLVLRDAKVIMPREELYEFFGSINRAVEKIGDVL